MHKNLFCLNNSSYMFRPTKTNLTENGDTKNTFMIQNVAVGVHK